jgi:hypothetical protein
MALNTHRVVVRDDYDDTRILFATKAMPQGRAQSVLRKMESAEQIEHDATGRVEPATPENAPWDEDA